MTRAVIYARYSSDNQRDASIEDQIRQCKAHVERQGWRLTNCYTDHALSGASPLRPGYQKLLEDARAGLFEIVVSEALDRLSRDQEHVASLFKQLSFAEVRLITLAEGEVGELHVGLKGTMNALFLKDLALKTHRGLEGRVRAGRSGGGLCYGYDVVRETDPSGNPVRGKRTVNEEEAQIVRSIFRDFTNGLSPTAIAKGLNTRGIPGPRGRDWGPSTIYGNWRRGTGILNNELYIGRLVWNRQHFVKDPSTGRRQARPNPESAWIVEEVPELRIVAQELWDAAKGRQKGIRRSVTSDRSRAVRSERARRPVYLFSGLLKCGQCGGSYSMVSGTTYGCANRKTRGTCDNGLTIKRTELEEIILSGLGNELMDPALVGEFIRSYHDRLNAHLSAEDIRRESLRKDLARIDKELDALVSAVKAGILSDRLQAEFDRLEGSRRAIEHELATDPPPPIRLHPNLADIYRKKVENLTAALNAEETRQEAGEIIRGLVDEISLVPDGDRLRIHLRGELAEMLALSTNQKPGTRGSGLKTTLVAGALFVRTHTLSLLAPNRSILCAGFGVKAEIPACMGVCGRIVAVADERLRWRSRG